MKKTIKSFFPIPKNKKTINSRSINGYASWMSILCFGLLLQIVSFLSIALMQNSYLILANRQSTLDLSCLSQARHIIHNNNIIRKCHYNTEDLILYEEMDMGQSHIQFWDEDTYIRILQKQPSKTIEMLVFYDEKGIVGFEIEKK